MELDALLQALLTIVIGLLLGTAFCGIVMFIAYIIRLVEG